jgi:hypothetical protein
MNSPISPLKTTQIIHFAFCTGILLFAGATLFINMESLKLEFSFREGSIEFLSPIVTGLGLFVGPLLFNKIIESIDENSNPSSKFVKYQTAFLVKCAFLESGALISIFACFITTNVLFMAFAALSFFSLWYAKPTREKVISTLQLQDSDLF